MTVHKTFTTLCLAAMVSLVFAATASAGPAGDEYLPQVPQSGAAPAAKTQTSGKDSKGSDKGNAVVPASSSGGDGGDSSGSILLNPLVLIVIAILIAAALGVTLWRRNADDADGDGGPGAKAAPDTAPRRGGPRTPDGEIIGPDRTG